MLLMKRNRKWELSLLKKRSWMWRSSMIRHSGKSYYRKWMMLWTNSKIINNWQKQRWWQPPLIILDSMISCAWLLRELRCFTICSKRDNPNTWRLTVNKKKQRSLELWLTFLWGSHKLSHLGIRWPILMRNLYQMLKEKWNLTITFKWSKAAR